MRKPLMLVLIILSLCLFVACENDSDTTQTGDKVVELRVAGQDPEDHPNTIALRELAERFEAGTNGRIKMSIYPANQLGDYTSVYTEVMKGTIDMALINVPSEYNEKFEMIYMPYLTNGYANVQDIYSYDSEFGMEFSKFHEEAGVKWMGFNMSGLLGIATNKEIKNPTEFGVDKDVLLRVPPLDLFKNHMVDLGFRTVTIPYSDLFTALQTGTAEGVVGTSPLDTYSTVRDVIDYYYLYNISFDCMSYIMNMDLFNSLKPEDQELLVDICRDLSSKSIANAKERDYEYLRKMEDENGIKIIEISPEDIEVLAEKTREKTWPTLIPRYGEDLINKMIELVE